MVSIVRTDLRVRNAEVFIDRYDTSGGISDYLYVGIGKSTVWGDENNPDVPTLAYEDEANFWDDLIGVQKVDATDITFVVPRIEWESGQEYYTFDETDPVAMETNFYAMNSENRVYKVESKSAPGTVTAVEPVAAAEDPVTGIVVTGDGYTWKFLYDIPLADITNLVTPQWITVNWGDKVSADQTSKGDVDAIDTLGAKYVMIRGIMEDTGLPVDISYRQVGLLSNPLDSLGDPLTATTALKADLTLYSGDLYYLENRTPVYRKSGQSETVKIVLEH